MEQYLIALSVFLFSWLCFYTYFIVVNKLSKRFWIKIDFWWISISLLAVLAAIFSYQRETATSLQNELATSIKIKYNLLAGEALKQRDYYLQRKNVPSSIADEELFFNVGRYFVFVENFLAEHEERVTYNSDFKYLDTLKKTYNFFMDTVSIPHVQKQTVDFAKYLNQLESDKDEIMRLEGYKKRDAISQFIFRYFPYLLSIAIALRMTKVNAQLQGLT